MNVLDKAKLFTIVTMDAYFNINKRPIDFIPHNKNILVLYKL